MSLIQAIRGNEELYIAVNKKQHKFKKNSFKLLTINIQWNYLVEQGLRIIRVEDVVCTLYPSVVSKVYVQICLR